MAHLRWQKPANGSDMLAIAQIRWHRTPEALTFPRHPRARDDSCQYQIFVSDLDRPLCHPRFMISVRVTPMHHLTIVVSSAPAGGGLAGGGRHNAEQGLRPGLRMEAGRPEPGQRRRRVLHPGQRKRGRAAWPLVGPGAKALGFKHGQLVERGPYDLLFGRIPTTAASARRSRSGQDQATTRSCGPPSRRSGRPRRSCSVPPIATPTWRPPIEGLVTP